MCRVPYNPVPALRLERVKHPLGYRLTEQSAQNLRANAASGSRRTAKLTGQIMWLTLALAVICGNLRCLGRFVVLAFARAARSNNGNRHER
jgi:hypothetical protein